MARRDGVTYEQVVAIADALVGGGQQPSVRAVREKLGTGSSSTILKHLVTWRTSRPVVAPVARAVSDTLTNAVISEIDRTVAQEKSGIEAQLALVQADMVELQATCISAEETAESLAEQVISITRERDVAMWRVEQLTTELSEAMRSIKQEQQSVEIARVDVATTKLSLDLHVTQKVAQDAEIIHLHAVLAKEQEARVVAERECAVAIAKLDGAEKQVSGLRVEVSQLGATTDGLRDALVKEREDHAVVVTRSAVLEATLGGTSNALAQAKDDKATLKDELTGLKAELKEARTKAEKELAKAEL